jgi:hypothetical protein
VNSVVQLDLFEDVERIPWYGVSPRSLTRSRKALFLSQEAQKDARLRDPAQLDLFSEATSKGPPVYRGAPLLRRLEDG